MSFENCYGLSTTEPIIRIKNIRVFSCTLAQLFLLDHKGPKMFQPLIKLVFIKARSQASVKLYRQHKLQQLDEGNSDLLATSIEGSNW